MPRVLDFTEETAALSDALSLLEDQKRKLEYWSMGEYPMAPQMKEMGLALIERTIHRLSRRIPTPMMRKM